jgi:hypothetical protein
MAGDDLIELENVDPDLNFLPSINSNILNYSNFPLDNSLSNTFTLFHSNVRSLSKNWNELISCLHLAAIKFSVIALTETWLHDTNASLFSLPDYRALHATRPCQRGGGVSLYVRCDIDLKARPDLDVFTQDIESIFAEVQLPSHGTFLIGAVYRPPNSNFNAFLDHLSHILTHVDRGRRKCYLLGDFNVNLFPSQPSPTTDEFLDVLYSWSFIPLIDRATRVSSSSHSVIDNIFTNNLTTKHESAIIMADISDHYPIIGFSDLILNSTTHCTIKTRNFSEANKMRFQLALQQETWEEVVNESSVQSAYCIFMAIIKDHFDSSFPLQEKRPAKTRNNPWMTPELKRSIKQKNKLYVLFKKRPSLINEISYKRCKNIVRSETAAAKKLYYQNLIERNKSNVKKLWMTLKEVIGSDSSSPSAKEFLVDGNLTDDKKLISDAFNDYFVKVGPTLANKIPATHLDPLSFLQGDFQESIFLRPVTELEVSNCLAKLKSSSAPGHDGLKPDIIKSASNFITRPLTHIINRIFESNYIPNEFKFAIVTPVHKGGDSTNFQNYRPISVLPVFSKVFERIMHARLYSFFDAHSVLCDQQFGFRSGYSTDMALITTIDQITASLDTGENVIGLFLDLRKAFDTVDYEILLRKLSFYGVRGNALLLCRNYLSGRSQSVFYNGMRSNVLPVTCGVPQGSILGPLLFLTYINDMKNTLTLCRPILYADDTNIFLSGKDLNTMTNTFNNELMHLKQWFTANRLSLNISKTHAMIFSLNRQISSHTLDLRIHNTPIDTTTQSKFLGIHIDNKLTWSTHISHICNKVSKSIGILTKASKYLNKATLLMLYNSFVLPYLRYGNIIWGKAASVHVSRLFVLQKRAVRIVCGAHFLAHTNPLFLDNRILKLHDLNTYLCAQFVFKIYHNIFPSAFSLPFHITPLVHPHHTRAITNTTARIPYCRTSQRQKTIAIHAPKLFNSDICRKDAIINSHSLTHFKKSVFEQIVQSYR